MNSPDFKTLSDSIIELISENSGQIIITTYGILEDNEVFQAILDELKKGRKVTVLTRPRSKNMSALKLLASNGAEVIGHFDIHAKVVLIKSNDSIKGILMTANIESISFTQSFESGKVLNVNQSKTLLRILNKWIDTFPLQFKVKSSRREVEGKFFIWNERKEKFEDRIIIDEKIVNVKMSEAPSINDYENFKPANLESKIPNEGEELFKKVIIKHSVCPPLLPPNAKSFQPSKKKGEKEKEVIKLPLYQKGKKKYVVVSNLKEIKQAERISNEFKADIVTERKYLINE